MIKLQVLMLPSKQELRRQLLELTQLFWLKPKLRHRPKLKLRSPPNKELVLMQVRLLLTQLQ